MPSSSRWCSSSFHLRCGHKGLHKWLVDERLLLCWCELLSFKQFFQPANWIAAFQISLIAILIAYEMRCVISLLNFLWDSLLIMILIKFIRVRYLWPWIMYWSEMNRCKCTKFARIGIYTETVPFVRFYNPYLSLYNTNFYKSNPIYQ